MLEWTPNFPESSANQSSLSYAIIPLDTSSFSLDEKEWNSLFATYDLIRHAANAVDEVENFKKLTDPWWKKGKRRQNRDDLFWRHRADISVVWITGDDRYMSVDEQINEAHHQIVQNRDDSFRAKINAPGFLNPIWLRTIFTLGSIYFVTGDGVHINHVEELLKNVFYTSGFWRWCSKNGIRCTMSHSHP